jgi:hypothetical protein
VFALTGLPRFISSDRGVQYTSKLITATLRLLGVERRVASSLNPRSNGASEQVILMASRIFRALAEDDTQIEEIIPWAEMALRASVIPGLGESPFFIVTGQQMRLPDAISGPLNDHGLTPDQSVYIRLMQKRLAAVREAIRANSEEMKTTQAQKYDTANKVATSDFKIGQYVRLHQGKIKPGSPRVITARPYEKLYVVVDARASPQYGQLYKLADARSGKIYGSLVHGNRIKADMSHLRDDLIDRLPYLPAQTAPSVRQQTPVTRRTAQQQQQQPAPPSSTSSHFQPYTSASHISKLRRTTSGSTQFYVHYDDGTQLWTDSDNVSPFLIRQYLLQKSRRARRPRPRTRTR